MDIMAGAITAGAAITTVGVEVAVITTAGDTIDVGKGSPHSTGRRLIRKLPDSRHSDL